MKKKKQKTKNKKQTKKTPRNIYIAIKFPNKFLYLQFH